MIRQRNFTSVSEGLFHDPSCPLEGDEFLVTTDTKGILGHLVPRRLERVIKFPLQQVR
jgi:hypothetical protein